MIPIPVFWTQYTATRKGRCLKFVPCENCSTEYVYIMEREASGVGTSVYLMNEQVASNHALSSSAELLQSVLENDFDLVPCPRCGHYQRYMFPRLLQKKGIGILALVPVVLLVALIAAVVAIKRTLVYLENPNTVALNDLILPSLIVVAMAVVGMALSILNRRRIHHFDPNLTDQQERIALGQGRAVTREEFDRRQQEQGMPSPPPE